MHLTTPGLPMLLVRALTGSTTAEEPAQGLLERGA
jgi:hypothetical protein